MNNPFARLSLVAILAVSALALGGCAAPAIVGASEGPAESPAPVISEPPSLPVVEETLVDAVDGTTVTALAIVTDFPSPPGATDGVHPVLVKVRIEAGDEFDGTVFDHVVSITPHEINLDYMTLGLGNPDALTPAMTAAGYTPLLSVERGQTATGWIGAWMNNDKVEYDLVYDRPEGTVFGGDRDGETVAASRDIVPLVVG